MNTSRALAFACLLIAANLAAPSLASAGNNPTYAEVHVTVVPQYVYANATYWVPVTFHIIGLGDHVKVEPGYQILFYADGKVLSPFPQTDPPFAYDNGRGGQENGRHNTYTAWISSTAVMNHLFNVKPDTTDCWFKVIGTFTDTDKGITVGPMESPRESSAEPLAFSDLHVAVAEIKKTTVFKFDDFTQQFFEASHDGVIDTHLTQVAGLPLQVPTLLQPASFPSYGFSGDTQGHLFGITGNRANVIPSSFGSHLTLDGDVNLGPSVSTLRMQSCTESVGIYWGNSYGFVVPNIISPNKGMALEQNSSGAGLDALPDSVETIATEGPNSGTNEFAPQADLSAAVKVVTFILAPEEWALVEGFSMFLEAKEVIEHTGVLEGGARAATINYRLILVIAAANGDGKDTPEILRTDASHVPADVSTTASGRYNTVNFHITAGSTSHYAVELENGIECQDFGLLGSSVDSNASFNYGSAGITVRGQ